jgi:hypothetical protein
MSFERSTWPLLCGCDAEVVDFDARVCTKVFELPRSELSPIIGHNIFGHAKHVHDFFDESHHLSCYN